MMHPNLQRRVDDSDRHRLQRAVAFAMMALRGRGHQPDEHHATYCSTETATVRCVRCTATATANRNGLVGPKPPKAVPRHE